MVEVLFDSASILASKSVLLLLLRSTFGIILSVIRSKVHYCNNLHSSKFGWKLEILDDFDLQPQSNEYDVGEIHDDLAFVLSLSLLSESHLSTGIVLRDIQMLSHSKSAGREAFPWPFQNTTLKIDIVSKPLIEFPFEYKSFPYTIIRSIFKTKKQKNPP